MYESIFGFTIGVQLVIKDSRQTISIISLMIGQVMRVEGLSKTH